MAVAATSESKAVAMRSIPALNTEFQMTRWGMMLVQQLASESGPRRHHMRRSRLKPLLAGFVRGFHAH